MPGPARGQFQRVCHRLRILGGGAGDIEQPTNPMSMSGFDKYSNSGTIAKAPALFVLESYFLKSRLPGHGLIFLFITPGGSRCLFLEITPAPLGPRVCSFEMPGGPGGWQEKD